MATTCNAFANIGIESTLCSAVKQRTCDIRVLENVEFWGLIIGALASNIGVSLTGISTADLQLVMNNALCALKSPQPLPALSESQAQQLILWLVNENFCRL